MENIACCERAISEECKVKTNFVAYGQNLETLKKSAEIPKQKPYREGRDQEIAPTEKLNDPIGRFDDCIGVLDSHIFTKLCIFLVADYVLLSTNYTLHPDKL